MAKRTLIRAMMPGWWHKHQAQKAKKAKVRSRDGDKCWRCGHAMRFGPPYNAGKAATLEHLVPKAKGGTDALENLRLCHVGCNRHLADHDPEQKERMRIGKIRRTDQR